MACSCQQILTLERTQHGWVQKTSFTHPDLHDELVEELVSLSSPFASAGAGSGASVFTFLLLGDQNAGKSTFLHAFSHAGSASWLALGSYLPILSASFLNASLRTDSATPPMDEPPFLDTDIGRASLLLTIEDFAFFVSEFELGAAVDVQALAAQRVAHVAVQLVEVGGDHLDSLMAAGEGDGGAPDDAWASVYARSRALIGGSRKSAYFVNAASLLRPDPAGRLRLDTTEAAPPVHRERAEEDRLMANGRAGPEEPPAEKQQPVALLGLRGRLALAAARPPRPVPASAPRHHRLQAARLAARLRYLASLLPPGPHQLVFYLSRLPPPEHGRGVFDEASAEAPPLASLAELLPAAEHAAVKAEAAARAAAAERRAAAADPHEELHPGLRLHAPPAPHAAPLCALLPALLGALLRLGDGGGGGAAARPGRGCELQLAEVILAPHLPAAPAPAPAPPAPPAAPSLAAPLAAAPPALDADAVVATLARLFRHEMLHGGAPQPPHATALLAAVPQLLACFKDCTARLHPAAEAGAGAEGGAEAEAGAGAEAEAKRQKGEGAAEALSFAAWVDEAAWEAHLESAPHGSLELPPNALLRAFAPLGAALASASLCVRHHAHGHARLSLRCRVGEGGEARRWPGAPGAPGAPAAEGAEGAEGAGMAVRFPYFVPLLRALERPLASGLPPQWWLDLGAGAGAAAAAAEEEEEEEEEEAHTLGGTARAAARAVAASVDSKLLREACELLQHELQAQLLRVRAARPAAWRVWLWLLEEWCLAHSLLRAHSPPQPPHLPHEAMDSAERGTLALVLGLPGALAPEVLSFLHPRAPDDGESEPHEAGGEGGWRVELLLQLDESQCCVPCEPEPPALEPAAAAAAVPAQPDGSATSASLTPVPRVNHDGVEGSSLPGGVYLARYGGGDDYAAAEPLLSVELPLPPQACPHWSQMSASLATVTMQDLRLLHGFSDAALLPGGRAPAADALSWRVQLCASRMPRVGGAPSDACSPMLHGWLFSEFGAAARKAHQKFPLLCCLGAAGFHPPGGEAPQWLPTDGRWSWADQHVHRDEPVDLGGFLFCEVFYGSDMARLAPVPGGSPATCWLAAVDAEAAQGLLTLCVILPEAEAGEGAEAALRDARTLADLAHALRSGWGEAAASELERLCMKP